MPTTLTGLLIFVVLLAPGFLYVVVTERGPFSRASHSMLRETASITLASLLCDLVALGLYIPAAASSRGRLPSLATLINNGEARWAEDRVELLLTAMGLLAVACCAALALGGAANRTNGFVAIKTRRPVSWILPAKGASTESAWWGVLKVEHPQLYRRVTCHLLDGTRVRGWLKRFNTGADESENRELTLAAPLRLTSNEGVHRHLESGFVTVSARQIQFLHVDYYPSPVETSGSQDPVTA